MLAYGVGAYALDEYLRISEDSVMLSLKGFCNSVVHLSGEEYLKHPQEGDLRTIMSIYAARGFPVCDLLPALGMAKMSIACARQVERKGKHPTVILEAIADSELWIWHGFCMEAGVI